MLLVVDGSNGAISLDRQTLSPNSLSMLHVVDGENKGDRISVIPELRSLLERWQLLEHAEVFFDGLGMGKKPEDPAVGTDCEISEHIIVRITPVLEEADGIIVQRVQERTSESPPLLPSSLPKTTDLDSALSSCESHGSRIVYTIQRNAAGSGKSRRLLRPYNLLRPGSYFCLFGLLGDEKVKEELQEEKISPTSSLCRDAKRLATTSKLLRPEVEQHVLGENGQKHTIVVTDDVFLRERVVDVGGFVMTFAQFWDLLVSAS